MKISECIMELTGLLKDYGDLPVFARFGQDIEKVVRSIDFEQDSNFTEPYDQFILIT